MADDNAKRDIAGMVFLGLLLVAAAVIAAAGLTDDLYVWGLIPAKWLLIPGGVMGLAFLGVAVQSAGAGGTVRGVSGFLARYKWVWLGTLAVGVLIGGIGFWEEYNAPQPVLVNGHRYERTQVKVTGAEPFTHVIEPGGVLDFAVPHGRHTIELSVGNDTTSHDVVHEGMRGDAIVIEAPKR